MINMQTHYPKVSILIPVFNRKEYIAECIQSALDQTYTDFEIVIVDNASEDGTWEICQQFATADCRVRIFRNESNIGPVRNWKRCSEEAKGEYSKILFSDDCLESNCLSEMVPKLVNPDVALVYCAARIGISRKVATIAYSMSNSPMLNSFQFLNLVLRGEAPVSPGAALMRTNDLKKNLHLQFPTSTLRNFEKNGAGPDVMIMLLTARNYKYVVNISTPLVYFRAHAGSFSIENSNNDVIKGYKSAISLFLIKNHNKKLWLDYISHCWLQEMRMMKKWINPKSYLIEYEGNGSLIELVKMLPFSMGHVVCKALGKKRHFIQ